MNIPQIIRCCNIKHFAFEGDQILDRVYRNHGCPSAAKPGTFWQYHINSFSHSASDHEDIFTAAML